MSDIQVEVTTHPLFSGKHRIQSCIGIMLMKVISFFLALSLRSVKPWPTIDNLFLPIFTPDPRQTITVDKLLNTSSKILGLGLQVGMTSVVRFDLVQPGVELG
jgi:hypothetical protein